MRCLLPVALTHAPIPRASSDGYIDADLFASSDAVSEPITHRNTVAEPLAVEQRYADAEPLVHAHSEPESVRKLDANVERIGLRVR